MTHSSFFEPAAAEAQFPDASISASATAACRTPLMDADAPLSAYLVDVAQVHDDECFFAAMGKLQRGRHG